ncbi:hypothetical protein [Acidianus infernus]|uniref:hypothetical protein n=1 Tax=Acidianus infernus TaxID=12915 RepID=UPI003594028D
MLTQTSSDVLLSIADDFLYKDDVVSPTRRATSQGTNQFDSSENHHWKSVGLSCYYPSLELERSVINVTIRLLKKNKGKA